MKPRVNGCLQNVRFGEVFVVAELWKRLWKATRAGTETPVAGFEKCDGRLQISAQVIVTAQVIPVTKWRCAPQRVSRGVTGFGGFAQVCSRGCYETVSVLLRRIETLVPFAKQLLTVVWFVPGPLTHAGAESIVRPVAGESTRMAWPSPTHEPAECIDAPADIYRSPVDRSSADAQPECGAVGPAGEL